MARRNRPHGSVNTINTGTSRRRRTAQGQLRDVSREREEQADRNESLNIAERLGHIPPLRRRHRTEPLQHLPDPDQAYPAHEPLIGSYLDEQLDPSIEEELPTAAHAAYHRVRRYAETRERISQRWSQLEISLTATFTLCQTITSNWTSQASNYELPPNTCTCNPDDIRTRKREKWAIKCPCCFGPQECEIKGHPDKPDVIIAMDGNFQQRHYAYASKDNPPESKYPSSFIPPSGIALDATQFSATKGAAVGIDLESANQIHEESALALAELHRVANPHTPGSNYTNQFFEQQWNDEQAYHVNTNRTADREQVELGRLLCLEEELNEAWYFNLSLFIGPKTI
ncbi:hypothetical protein PtA15_5A378 [Puccinia triticina]|uniref:CxC1-like cysteine cluster associated with KDZ transposases domain-containing protein n=1 Tax=Puccinia triticina TaxID=208348 RepID=A0ABY7CI90_9BASI|nr:uncharacterized protein PtA15_5A378 [Puccinia triticina]WAQ84805.1 hypothetical protein PtA15_5A378 [Puccinia triticina]